MSLTRTFPFVVVLAVLGGCVLQARSFLPATGRYISVHGDPADGGWKADSLVVTSEAGNLTASVRVWINVDAGDGVVGRGPLEAASVMVVNARTGAIETAEVGSVLLPNPVVAGARWRVTNDSSCFVQEEVVAVSARQAEITHRFGCDDTVEPPFMRSTWQVGGGWVRYELADGGLSVRITRVEH